MPARTRRILRLTAFTLLAALLAYLLINTGLAWTFVYFLTHPGCQRDPPPLEGLPAPEEHLLQTADKLSLRAWYYPPQNGAVVIALGGSGGSLGNNLPPIAFLIRRGYGVLQIDSRACARPPAPVTIGAKEIEDVAAGLDFLKAQPEVQRIGVLGFSMGGVAAVRAAARHSEIAAIINDGGYFNLGEDFVEPGEPKSPARSLLLYTIAGLFWAQSGANPWQVSPIDDLPGISPRPVFLIYGEYEAGSGRAEAQFAAAHDPKQLWIVPGGRHGQNHLVAPQEYEQRVLAFFDRYLLNRLN